MILIIDHENPPPPPKKTRVYEPAFNLFDGVKDIVPVDE